MGPPALWPTRRRVCRGMHWWQLANHSFESRESRSPIVGRDEYSSLRVNLPADGRVSGTRIRLCVRRYADQQCGRDECSNDDGKDKPLHDSPPHSYSLFEADDLRNTGILVMPVYESISAQSNRQRMCGDMGGFANVDLIS